MEAILEDTNKVLLDRRRFGLGRRALSAAAGAASTPPRPAHRRRPLRHQQRAGAEHGSPAMNTRSLGFFGGSPLSSPDLRLHDPLHRAADRDRAGAAIRQAGEGHRAPGPAVQAAVSKRRDLRPPDPRFRAAGRRGDRLRPEAVDRRYLCPLQDHQSAALLSKRRHRSRRRSTAQQRRQRLGAPRHRQCRAAGGDLVAARQHHEADSRRGESTRARITVSTSSTCGCVAPICRKRTRTRSTRG